MAPLVHCWRDPGQVGGRDTAWSRGSIWWLLNKLQRDFPQEVPLPQGTDRRILQVYLDSQVHSSTAQDSRKGEETQASMDGWTEMGDVRMGGVGVCACAVGVYECVKRNHYYLALKRYEV